MKFKQYINESEKEITDLDEFNTHVHNNCKPYLNLIKTLQHPFIREMLGDFEMGIKMVRQDRKPRATNVDTFKRFNDWLAKHKHNRRDNSVMASFEPAKVFGMPYYIFPIGKVSYTWIKANDVNMNDNSTGWNDDTIEYYDFKKERYTRDKRSWLPNFNDWFTTDSGYDVAARHEYEIWFNCKQYMYIESDREYWWSKRRLSMMEGYDKI